MEESSQYDTPFNALLAQQSSVGDIYIQRLWIKFSKKLDEGVASVWLDNVMRTSNLDQTPRELDKLAKSSKNLDVESTRGEDTQGDEIAHDSEDNLCDNDMESESTQSNFEVRVKEECGELKLMKVEVEVDHNYSNNNETESKKLRQTQTVSNAFLSSILIDEPPIQLG